MTDKDVHTVHGTFRDCEYQITGPKKDIDTVRSFMDNDFRAVTEWRDKADTLDRDGWKIKALDDLINELEKRLKDIKTIRRIHPPSMISIDEAERMTKDIKSILYFIHQRRSEVLYTDDFIWQKVYLQKPVTGNHKNGGRIFDDHGNEMGKG